MTAEVFLPLGLFDSPKGLGGLKRNMIGRRAVCGEVLWNELGVREIQAVQFMAHPRGTRKGDYSSKQIIKK